MIPQVTMRNALSDPQLLGGALGGASWAWWRVLLTAAAGEPLTPSELEIFQRVTGRENSPSAMVEEALFLIGRRGGKDRSTSVLVAYIAGLCEHPSLVKGERGVVLVIAPDARQAGVQLDYVEGVFRSSPLLAKLIFRRNADSLSLTNGVTVEVRAASFRRLRGLTCVAVIASEAAFWFSEDGGSSNVDTEILNAIRPTLATTRGPLVLITTPYAKRGEVWSMYSRHFGAQGDERILVAQGTSREFNPTLRFSHPRT
jgi:hypothetical protein